MDRRRIATAAAAAAVAPVMLMITAGPAHADTCRGANSVSKFFQDPNGNGEGYRIKMDSCKIQEDLKQRQDNISRITAGSALTAFVPRVSKGLAVPGVYLNLQHQINKQTLESCASAGTGVSYQQINGWVQNCKPQ